MRRLLCLQRDCSIVGGVKFLLMARDAVTISSLQQERGYIMSAKEDQKKILKDMLNQMSNDIPYHQWAISHHEKEIESLQRSIRLAEGELAKIDAE